MTEIKKFDAFIKPTFDEKREIVEFLHKHLGKYGDPLDDIEKSVNYALKEYVSFGGFVLVSYYESQIAGVVVINHTGMKGFIPENILVYIATRENLRGRGIGKRLMEEAINMCDGGVALHVEPDNPAKGLYQKLGFTNKYLEMRYTKQ